jgi:hypothetical protein
MRRLIAFTALIIMIIGCSNSNDDVQWKRGTVKVLHINSMYSKVAYYELRAIVELPGGERKNLEVKHNLPVSGETWQVDIKNNTGKFVERIKDKEK